MESWDLMRVYLVLPSFRRGWPHVPAVDWRWLWPSRAARRAVGPSRCAAGRRRPIDQRAAAPPAPAAATSRRASGAPNRRPPRYGRRRRRRRTTTTSPSRRASNLSSGFMSSISTSSRYTSRRRPITDVSFVLFFFKKERGPVHISLFSRNRVIFSVEHCFFFLEHKWNKVIGSPTEPKKKTK